MQKIKWIDPNCFGQRVKCIRESLGLTQEELAEKSGLKASAISHIESGRREPGLTNIRRICKGLGCKIEKLIIIVR